MASDIESMGDDIQDLQREIEEFDQENRDPNDDNENVLVERNEQDADGADLTDSTKVKPKRVTRNPQPKLNEETVKSTRGIASLEKHFERVKLKNRGFEEDDLTTILKTYEYWCHRLFPKFPFDECVARLEKLGTKKAVVTHIKRIRHDLLFEEKPIESDNEDDIPTDGFVDIQNSTPAHMEGLSENETSLTEEQLNRIRENKEKAEQLRQERLRAIRTRAEIHLEPSNSLEAQGESNLLNHATESEISNQNQRTILTSVDKISEVNQNVIDSQVDVFSECDIMETDDSESLQNKNTSINGNEDDNEESQPHTLLITQSSIRSDFAKDDIEEEQQKGLQSDIEIGFDGTEDEQSQTQSTT